MSSAPPHPMPRAPYHISFLLVDNANATFRQKSLSWRLVFIPNSRPLLRAGSAV
jgi:hypothetical protein